MALFIHLLSHNAIQCHNLCFFIDLAKCLTFLLEKNSSEERSFGGFEYTSRLMIVGDTFNVFIFFNLFYNLEITLFPHDLYDGTNLVLTGVNID